MTRTMKLAALLASGALLWIVALKLPIVILAISFVCLILLTATVLTIDLVQSFFIALLELILLIALISLGSSVFATTHLFLIISVLLCSMSLGIAAWLLFRPESKRSFRMLPRRKSLVSLIAAIMCFLFFSIYPLTHRSPPQLLSFLSSGEDNISHFSLVNFIYTHDTPAYRHSEGVWRGLANYPQGLHTSVAYLARLLDQTIDARKFNLLLLYYLCMAGLAATAVFFSVNLLISVLRRYSKIIGAFTYAALAAGVIFLFFLVPYVKLGYFAQLGALCYIVALVYLHTIYKSQKESIGNFLLTLIALIGTMVTWYLAVALITPLIGYYFIRYRQFWQKALLFVPVTLLASLAPIYHIFIGGSGAALTDRAGDPFGLSSTVLYLVTALLLLYFFLQKKYYTHRFFALLVGSYVLTLILGSVQLLFLGTVNYFFFKLMSLFFIILICSTPLLNQGKSKSLMLVSIGFVLIFIAIQVDGKTQALSHLSHFYRYQSQLTYLPLDNALEVPYFSKQSPHPEKDSIFISSCNKLNQYMINRWLGAFLLTQTDQRRNFEMNTYQKLRIEKEDITDYIAASRTPIKIGFSSYCNDKELQ